MTAAKIAAVAKATKTLGVTPDAASEMWKALDSHHYGIVDLVVVERSEGTDDKSVKLELSTLELAADKPTITLLQELARAIYLQRQPEVPLTAGQEDTPADVAIKLAKGVLDCDRCGESLADKKINHGRRKGVICIQLPSRRPVAGQA